MKEKYDKCSVYTNETVLSEKEKVRIKHRAMLYTMKIYVLKYDDNEYYFATTSKFKL